MRLLNPTEFLASADDQLHIIQKYDHPAADPAMTNHFVVRPSTDRVDADPGTDSSVRLFRRNVPVKVSEHIDDGTLVLACWHATGKCTSQELQISHFRHLLQPQYQRNSSLEIAPGKRTQKQHKSVKMYELQKLHDRRTLRSGMPKYKRAALSKAIRFDVFKRDSFKCQYCGRSAPEIVLHCDHIHPVAAGGDSEITNLITACVDCNRGKGARKLSDQSTLAKQKAQLDELQERREQLEMLMEWKTGLTDIASDAATRLAEYWKTCVPGMTVNHSGTMALRHLATKYGADVVSTAIDRAARQYVRWDNGTATLESVTTAWAKVEAICRMAVADQEKPYLKDILYVRAILVSRFGDERRSSIMPWLEAAFSWGISPEQMKRLAKEAISLASFTTCLHSAIKHLRHDFPMPVRVYDEIPMREKGATSDNAAH